MQFDIYTDGSCLGQPAGAGGFGAIILLGGKSIREVSGPLEETTSVRAELMGIIAGLEALAEPSEATVYSDNQPIIDSVNKATAQAKNADLWQRLREAAARHTVTFRWVKGHNGNPWNTAAHKLSLKAARGVAAKPAKVRPQAAKPVRLHAPTTPEAALALDFARECLGWDDALLDRITPPCVTTGLVKRLGYRLLAGDLGNVMGAATAWAAVSEGVVQTDLGYVVEERLYAGSVLVGEEWVQAHHEDPCQALMQACLQAARRAKGVAACAAG